MKKNIFFSLLLLAPFAASAAAANRPSDEVVLFEKAPLMNEQEMFAYLARQLNSVSPEKKALLDKIQNEGGGIVQYENGVIVCLSFDALKNKHFK